MLLIILACVLVLFDEKEAAIILYYELVGKGWIYFSCYAVLTWVKIQTITGSMKIGEIEIPISLK